MSTFTVLPADGDPAGVRVQLPDGRVTSYHNHGGALDSLTEAESIQLAADVAAFETENPSEQ